MKENEMNRRLQGFLDVATPWQKRVVEIINMIPTGCLATYGSIAGRAGNQHSARAVGTLRRNLYSLLGPEPNLPLHRICSKGDVLSLNDSEDTRDRNDRLRTIEGSLQNPEWF